MVAVEMTLSGRLDQLDENPAGILGVDEVDKCTCRSAPGLVVQNANSTLPQGLSYRLNVLNAVGHLLQARAVVGEELANG
jgi:hypothetical protein